MQMLEYGDKGPRVKALQHLLAYGKFGNFHPGPLDGQIGPRTSAAIQKAKRLLGYRISDVKPVAGDPLFEYLSGRRALSPLMLVRRRARLAAARKRRLAANSMSQMRVRVLRRIKGEIGTMEAGGHSNVIKYNSWWGWGAVAYCAIGVSWAWVMEGSKAFARGSRWAGTDVMLYDAKNGDKGLILESDPLPGCPGVIDFDGHSDPDHCITFVRWADAARTIAVTAEFNTTGGNGMEGVWESRRPAGHCWWFEVTK